MTGQQLCNLGAKEDPVRKAYQLHTLGQNRPSWDLATTRCAVRGHSDYWTVEKDGYCYVNSDRSNE